MSTIYIDHIPYEVTAGKNLLEACLSLGFDLPYFCWHPAMGSVGACRQCAVKLYKDDQDTSGRLVMSCMETVRDDLYLSVQDETAKAFRTQIIEWLMTNHPHDCAVCDEGGSCHLQDMTVMTGHTYRRFKYKKRTYINQYLGPFLNHEMNRCIQCYRCVRFYKDYAGGKDLDVFAAHDHVYFGRAQDGILENEFGGNLVEVCPTGVFTDKTLKEHYTRKWDLTMAPSICQHCSLGCNIIAGERYGQLRQITNRYNQEVNGYFICDRGRFGYEFVNSVNRIKQPLIRSRLPEAVDKFTLMDHLSELVSGPMTGIGSARASLESNFALRQLVGKEHFYQGVPDAIAEMMDLVVNIYDSGDVRIPSLKEVESADVVLILGEDLINSAPRLALSVRQAVRNEPLMGAQKINIPQWHDAALRELTQEDKGECIIIFPTHTTLDEISSQVHSLAPDEIARLGFTITSLLNAGAPRVEGLNENMLDNAKAIAFILQNARNPLIISGTSLFSTAIIKAAASIAAACGNSNRRAMLSLVVPECNSMGLAMMKAAPFSQVPEESASTKSQTLVILENDLYQFEDEMVLDKLFSTYSNIIVLDHLNNRTTSRANVLIPAATFAEGHGTLVNNEGRAQSFFQVFKSKNDYVRESWRWLHELAILKNKDHFSEKNLQQLVAEMVAEMPQFAGAEEMIPEAAIGLNGQRIPREPHRYSGRTAMNAHEDVDEPKPPVDPDSPLSFTMEGFRGIPPAPLTPFFWAPGWNSNQSLHKYQTEIGGPLYGNSPGFKLLNNINRQTDSHYDTIPAAFVPSKDEWVIIPLHHIFGSEELSMYTGGVSERAPQPYVALGSMDAQNLDVKAGEMLKVKIGVVIYELPLRIKAELDQGTAGLPYNLRELSGIKWPVKGTITKESR